MALEDLPRCFLASQLLERSVDAGGSADGEGMWLGNRGITPSSTSGRCMGEENKGGELGVCNCKGGMFRSHVNKT